MVTARRHNASGDSRLARRRDGASKPSVVPWNALPAGTVGAHNSSFSAHSHRSPPFTRLGHHGTSEGLLARWTRGVGYVLIVREKIIRSFKRRILLLCFQVVTNSGP